jgi:hypothetical protein
LARILGKVFRGLRAGEVNAHRNTDQQEEGRPATASWTNISRRAIVAVLLSY